MLLPSWQTAEMDDEAVGEVVEFDPHVPHWFGNSADVTAEVLILFGPQGERMHVDARPRAR